jgi:Glycosyltransferase family 87
VATAREQRTRHPLGARDVIPVVCLIVSWAGMLLWLPDEALKGDVLRFQQIVHASGRLWLDVPVEYPPAETMVILLTGHGSVTAIARQVAAVNGVATLATWWTLRAGWSASVGRLFLWFSLPLQLFMPFRLDMVSVLLIVVGIVVAERGQQITGGVSAGVAVLFKLWPLAVVPVLLIRRQHKALIAAGVTLVLGVALWLALFGLDAASQVLTYRDATGWHVESVFGIATYVGSSADPRIDAGASRIGMMVPWQVATLRVVTVVLITLIWIRAPSRRVDPCGGPALAAVATLLFLSPVASPQYVSWLLPWAAITASERRQLDVRILMVAAGVFASAVFSAYWGNHDLFLLEVLSAGRALCVLGLAVIGFSHKANQHS